MQVEKSAFTDGVLALVSYPVDADGDDVSDLADNCLELFNADQRDTDDDGYGNACDPDLDNSAVVNFADLMLFRQALFATPESPAWNADADFNGDSVVNFEDLIALRRLFFQAPGPSAAVD